MIAYHGNPDLKARFVGLLEQHRQLDQIIQGVYWSDGRGCAVGCSIDSLMTITGRWLDRSDHCLYEELIGVPQLLARLEDGIFEGLPIERARDWPIAFATAIPIGADLSLAWPRFAVWLLDDPDDGVIRFARTDTQRRAIRDVADLYRRQLEGVIPERSEWKAAYAADAAYAAYAAAYAADAAKQQVRIRQADKLLHLLASCDVPAVVGS